MGGMRGRGSGYRIANRLSRLYRFLVLAAVTDAGAHVILNYRLSDHILLRATGDLRQFEGDASHSPIIETKTQAFIGLGIGYHFQAG